MNKNNEKKVILVIEDERPLIKVIEKKLENNGFDVVTARTVAQGLSYLEDMGSVAAVWLDHYLVGEETGIDFVKQVRCKGSKWAKLPIFVVSNTASNTNVKVYIKLGVTNYCVKAEHRLDQITDDLKTYLKGNKRLIN